MSELRNKPTLSVSDLREILEELEEKGFGLSRVFMSSDYGDRSHTIQLLRVKAVVSTIPVCSVYSSTGLALGEDYTEYSDLEDKEDSGATVTVIVLK